MVTMGRSGFQAAYSLVRDRGSMGLSTSMDTWIIISTIARDTTGLCQRAASGLRITVQSFAVRRCMTLTDTKHRAATDKAVGLQFLQLQRLSYRKPIE